MAGDLQGIASDAEPIDAELIESIPGRELFAMAAWTALADLLIFRGSGFLGPAVFLAMTPILFWVVSAGSQNTRLMGGWVRRIVVALCALVALRLGWSGSPLAVFSGVVLVVALSMASAGYVPYVLEGMVLAMRSAFDGIYRLAKIRLTRWAAPSVPQSNPTGGQPSGAESVEMSDVDASSHRDAGIEPATAGGSGLVAYVLPMVAMTVFGAIFVFANPNLFDWVSTRLETFVLEIQSFVLGMSIWEIPFCILALVVGAGLLRPMLPLARIGPEASAVPLASVHHASRFYAAYRNTLVTLIGLFAAYLAFEFVTLWKRDFPDGFYYAGYAHQGAAWLTYALALATALLSLIFGGSMLRDQREPALRKLAWVWSAQNLLLAAAVYNRLMIYVGYNGLTRLRMVGFFGITLVVIGFVLVLYKIKTRRSFWWLIRSQLVAFVLTVIAYSIVPIDYVVNRYNVAVVQSGYLHPVVMIAVKPTQDEGVYPVLDLVDHNDPVIRDGIRALIAERQVRIEDNAPNHWTEYQLSTWLLDRRLKQDQQAWIEFWDPVKRKIALDKFKEHAMQWY